MNRRALRLATLVLCTALVVTAVASVAVATQPPTVTLTPLARGPVVLLKTLVTGGTAPYIFEWSVNGGPFAPGPQIWFLLCGFDTGASVRVIDDDGLVSNVATFTCP